MKKFFPAYCLQYKASLSWVGIGTFLFLTALALFYSSETTQLIAMVAIAMLMLSLCIVCGVLIDREGILLIDENMYYRRFRKNKIRDCDISQIILLPSSFPLRGHFSGLVTCEYISWGVPGYLMVMMRKKIDDVGNFCYSESDYFIRENRPFFLAKAAFNRELLDYLLSRNPSISVIKIDQTGMNEFKP